MLELHDRLTLMNVSGGSNEIPKLAGVANIPEHAIHVIAIQGIRNCVWNFIAPSYSISGIIATGTRGRNAYTRIGRSTGYRPRIVIVVAVFQKSLANLLQVILLLLGY